jgi:hypothetical protein
MIWPFAALGQIQQNVGKREAKGTKKVFSLGKHLSKQNK